MLFGIAATIFAGIVDARDALRKHQTLICARDKLKDDPSLTGASIPADEWWKEDRLANTQDLRSLGCTSWPEWVSTRSILATSDDFNWMSEFLSRGMLVVLGITLAVTFAVYAIVRATGWVIGGFVAS